MQANCGSAFRAHLACLLIACLLFVSTSLACGAHDHSGNSSSHCCTVCHFGHLPWMQASVTASILPPAAHEWRQCSEKTRQIVESGAAAASSRAPPVLSYV